MDELKAILEKIGAMLDDINVDVVFGKPETVGERVLIPVAEISYGFGAGFGGGPACCCKEDECYSEGAGEACTCHEADEVRPCCQDEAGVAGGGGGGAGGRARPIAYIEVGPDGTKVEPIVDEQKIALGGMLLGAWAIAWIALVLKTLFRALAPRN